MTSDDGWGAQIRRKVTSLEAALANYNEQGCLDEELKRHLVAMSMYCRDGLRLATEVTLSPAISGGVTTYTSLVSRLRPWAKQTSAHVCFVNFNYDLLLETACMNWQWGFDRTP